MKHTFITIVAALVAICCLSAFDSKTPQERYIEKYAATAVREMYRTGVPASITLAQGLLESGSGLSKLALEGNNHFGIKCHEWTGKKMYYDDDEKGECFRVYSNADESFKDHSDFLRYRDRYKSLFDNKTTDYKSWAYGLKKAGYATDPAYPQKLIAYIETYNLSRFDTMKLEDVGAAVTETSEPEEVEEKPAETKQEEVQPQAQVQTKQPVEKKSRKKKHHSKKADEPKEEETVVEENAIPESPLSLEAPQKYTPKSGETFTFKLTRPIYLVNGVKCVYAIEGETYESIAESYNLFKKEILKFNDLSTVKPLNPGDLVYIEPKKNQAAKGLDYYVTDSDDETLWGISQRFAVKLESLKDMNGYGNDFTPKEDDKIVLREQRRSIKNLIKK